MMHHRPQSEEVFVVDDEPAICELFAALFTLEGYHVTSFAEGDSFLTAARERTPAFILLDLNMPGRSGLDVLEELDAASYPAPVFMISAHGDVPSAIDAIKKGALDFIEKPFEPEAVVARIRDTLAQWTQMGGNGQGILSHSFPGYELLTPRERDVLAQIANGASNKETGRRLKISPRTVEVHRARIMEKIGARNAADLVRIVLSEGR
jgi:two-component system, LuxR family, response regulator FixJ